MRKALPPRRRPSWRVRRFDWDIGDMAGVGSSEVVESEGGGGIGGSGLSCGGSGGRGEFLPPQGSQEFKEKDMAVLL